MGLTKKQVSEIRLRLQNGERGCDLAKEFGVSDSYISQIKSHKRGMKQVWLTVEEAKRALGCIQMSRAIADDVEGKDKELQLKLQERIEQAEKENEAK